jgi:alginate O-acetyltransferase complex protein AlgI
VLFNSLTFVVFFTVVLAVHYAPLSWRTKKVNLLVASYLFYAAWNPPFVILLWVSTLVDWNVARWLHAAEDLARRRLLLFLSLATNLGILGYFKYGEFVLENWQSLMASVGVDYVAPEWGIVLPVGISFYTFQTMAYSMDVYLRRSEPSRSFLDFALFVTFFPQLVAGPIVRPSDLIPQFATPHQARARQLGWGLSLMVLGIFQKVVIADGLFAPSSDLVFGAEEQVSFLDAWLGTLAFSGQIFSDFAGYSTTAIGAALCLGFSIPTNFRFPYAAIGFSDFWRRWHISLSTWLRDYLYIPLGGNRMGVVKTYRNLALTMLLGGLWHGSAWTFVVWGGLHGTYLAVERWLGGRSMARPAEGERSWMGKLGLGLLTYFLVNLTWVFFRAADFPEAWRLIRSMFGFAGADAGTPLPTLYILFVSFSTVALVTAHWLMRDRTLEEAAEAAPPWLLTGALAAMAFLIITTQGAGDAFIYFQF